jgi:hypothetical protein
MTHNKNTTQSRGTELRSAAQHAVYGQMLLCVVLVVSFAGCQSLEKGISGLTSYLQLVVDDRVVWEHSTSAGYMSCETNAALNNQELAKSKEAQGRYRCVKERATESALPYSYVSSYREVRPGGVAFAAPTTTRFASSEACWESIAKLEVENLTLVRENCGSKSPPVRPGQKLA